MIRLPKLPAEPATALGALRIVVAALVLLGPGLREGARVAESDPRLRVAPEGLAWFLAHVPVTGPLATGVQVLTVFAALLVLVGIRARPALVVMTLGATYLYALAELTGSVWHDMHILWLSALLAASPCDHALALDAPRPEPPRSIAYAVPLTFARLLLGAVYFFPGFHKLHTSGIAWALSDNLRNQLYFKWAEHGAIPSFRIDHHPWLLAAGGLTVLAFELGAPVLFLVPRTRVVGAVAGVAFHLLAQWIFRIPFLSLWACYVVLLDLRPLIAWARKKGRKPEPEPGPEPGPEPEPGPGLGVSLLVGSLLLAGAVIQGARGQMQAFPFACYPTFEWMAGTEMPDLRMTAVFSDGREVLVPHARDGRGYRTQRQWGTVWSLAAVARAPGETHAVDLERLRAYYLQNTRNEPARALAGGAVRVRFSRAMMSVIPERAGDALVREVPLGEIALRTAGQ